MVRRNKVVIIIIITICLLISYYAGLYIIGIKSEPYQFAVKYIKTNEIIAAKIGQLKSHRLDLWGYTVSYSGPRGRAEYKILVEGEKDNGEVYLKLKKLVGRWKVVEANLKLNSSEIIELAQIEE